MTEQRAIQIFAPAVSVVFLAILSVLVWNTARFSASALRVVGYIVERDPHPLVRFTTATGATIVFRQNGNTGGPAGKAVPVAYAAADPAGTACVATVWALWGTVLFLTPLGILAVLILAMTGAGWIRR